MRCVPLVMALPFSCGAAFAGEIREFSETGAEIYSKDFYSIEFEGIRNEAGRNRFDRHNRLIWDDNKLVMASLLPEVNGRIDLIYIDPLFDAGADFKYTKPGYTDCANVVGLFGRDTSITVEVKV